MNLINVGPLPPIRSGVADYSAVLLPHLRSHFARMAVLVDGYVPQLPSGLVDQVCDISDETDWWQGGRVIPLYHMGNQIHFHRYVFRTLQRFPGVTVLHDGNLLPFVNELTLMAGDRAGFLREAGFERGVEGMVAAQMALRRAEPLLVDEYPMIARVAYASLGVIVHSRYLRDRVLEAFPQARVEVIPLVNMMSHVPDMVSRRDLKISLGLPPESLLVGTFGFVAPSKRVGQALEAFARVREVHPEARFVCVGEVVPDYNLETMLDRLGLEGAARVTGYVPPDVLLKYTQAVDVGLNLRYPTWGESSAALVHMMTCGVPTIVTDMGAFAELPDGAVLKVSAGLDEVDAIEIALRQLLGDAHLRAEVSARARAFVEEHCDPEKVAAQYAAFIRACVV